MALEVLKVFQLSDFTKYGVLYSNLSWDWRICFGNLGYVHVMLNVNILVIYIGIGGPLSHVMYT